MSSGKQLDQAKAEYPCSQRFRAVEGAELLEAGEFRWTFGLTPSLF